MEISDLSMEEMSLKDVWKSVSMEHGALCVMTFGVAKIACRQLGFSVIGMLCITVLSLVLSNEDLTKRESR